MPDSGIPHERAHQPTWGKITISKSYSLFSNCLGYFFCRHYILKGHSHKVIHFLTETIYMLDEIILVHFSLLPKYGIFCFDYLSFGYQEAICFLTPQFLYICAYISAIQSKFNKLEGTAGGLLLIKNKTINFS